MTRLNNGLRILFEASKPGGEAIKGDAAALRDARQRVGTASRQLKDMEHQLRSTNQYLRRCIAELQSDAHTDSMAEGDHSGVHMLLEEGSGETMLLGTLQALLEASGSTEPSQKQQHLAEAKMCYLRLLDRLQQMYHGLMEEGKALRETLGWEASNWVVGDRESKWVAHRDHTQRALLHLERGLTRNSHHLQLRAALKQWSRGASSGVPCPPKARIRFADLAEALDQMTREATGRGEAWMKLAPAKRATRMKSFAAHFARLLHKEQLGCAAPACGESRNANQSS